jgi:hypothetical protein
MSTNPLGMVELITAIGDQNIRMQNLDTSAITLDYHHKKGTTITFGTDAALTANGTELMGLVLWVPRDKVQQILAERSKP